MELAHRSRTQSCSYEEELPDYLSKFTLLKVSLDWKVLSRLTALWVGPYPGHFWPKRCWENSSNALVTKSQNDQAFFNNNILKTLKGEVIFDKKIPAQCLRQLSEGNAGWRILTSIVSSLPLPPIVSNSHQPPFGTFIYTQGKCNVKEGFTPHPPSQHEWLMGGSWVAHGWLTQEGRIPPRPPGAH